jgi:hypothetical protein
MGELRAASRRLEPAFRYRTIQGSNCCVRRAICCCCNAMMVRIESHMQQPRSVLSRNLFRFGIPPDSFRIDEAVTNRSSLKPLRSRQNDHVSASWVEHVAASIDGRSRHHGATRSFPMSDNPAQLRRYIARPCSRGLFNRTHWVATAHGPFQLTAFGPK